MKANLRKAHGRDSFVLPKQTKQVTQEIEAYFSEWLKTSNLTEAVFLENYACNHFKVMLNHPHGEDIAECKIGYIDKHDCFKQIGMTFLSNGNQAQLGTWYLNMGLLLVYIATKLDMERKRKWNIGKGQQDDYFFQCVKKQWSNRATSSR